jgi:hypothetical protein
MISLNLHKIICAYNFKKISYMPIYTKRLKTCSIKLKIFITIVIKQICISLRMFSDVKKKKIYVNI